MNILNKLIALFLSVAIFYGFNFPIPLAEANIIDSLREAITGRKSDLHEIDQEIRELEGQVVETRQERMTLQQAVDALSSQQRQLLDQINGAEQNINEIGNIMNDIDNEIDELEANIETKLKVVASNIRRINVMDDESIIVGLLRHNSLAEYWREADVSEQLNAALSESMREVRNNQQELLSVKEAQIARRAELIRLQGEIRTKKTSIDIARAEQDELLAATRSEEASYQQILEQKRQQRVAFEQDLSTYESQLNLAVNPATIPVAESAALTYPVDNVIITQYFGDTAFARSGAYSGRGHNGVDFGVPVGTPVKSARQGVVKATGDTDQQCRYASYGKWILVEHDNGLSTLYAHLSGFTVTPGQSVARGQVIGYSGNTGYSTGPHLHFTVYASSGVKVGNMPSRSCPGTAFYLPLANMSAYLNPMSYLP